jgi:hypothetical protein
MLPKRKKPVLAWVRTYAGTDVAQLAWLRGATRDGRADPAGNATALSYLTTPEIGELLANTTMAGGDSNAILSTILAQPRQLKANFDPCCASDDAQLRIRREYLIRAMDSGRHVDYYGSQHPLCPMTLIQYQLLVQSPELVVVSHVKRPFVQSARKKQKTKSKPWFVASDIWTKRDY